MALKESKKMQDSTTTENDYLIVAEVEDPRWLSCHPEDDVFLKDKFTCCKRCGRQASKSNLAAFNQNGCLRISDALGRDENERRSAAKTYGFWTNTSKSYVMTKFTEVAKKHMHQMVWSGHSHAPLTCLACGFKTAVGGNRKDGKIWK